MDNLKLKKSSKLDELEKKDIVGFVVLDAYMEGFQEKYRNDIIERLESMGRFNLLDKSKDDIYNKMLYPIYRTFEEAWNFVEFAYGNTDKTYVIKKVKIKIQPEILDINASHGDN